MVGGASLWEGLHSGRGVIVGGASQWEAPFACSRPTRPHVLDGFPLLCGGVSSVLKFCSWARSGR